MARDLYGTMLSRALNRGAPQGHFAAYIQPNEAALLRAHGGGVPPGGGQYMANGVPSYQTGAMAGVSAGSRQGARDLSGRGGGGDRSGSLIGRSMAGAYGSGFSPASSGPGRRFGAVISPPDRQATAPYSGASPSAVMQEPALNKAAARAKAVSIQNNALAVNKANAEVRREAVEDLEKTADYNLASDPNKEAMKVAVQQQYRSPFSNEDLQTINMNATLSNRNLSSDDRMAELGKPISEGGIGKWSPGYEISKQSQPEGGMRVEDAIRHVWCVVLMVGMQ